MLIGKNRDGFGSSKKSSSARATRRKRRAWPRVFQGRRLFLERLEDRCVLSVATVNTALDVVNLSDGVTSLREAILITNILVGHDTIQFAESLHSQTISLSAGELTISDALTITGPGGNLIVIDATEGDDTPDLFDGQGSRIFNVNDGDVLSSIEVNIAGVSLRGGDAMGNGGAILNVESLTLSDVNISSNNATGNGGGVYNENGSLAVARSNYLANVGAIGGGVYSTGGNLTIDSSTFNGNIAMDKAGGVFSQDNVADIVNSTFSGNISETSGGGLFLQPAGTSTASVRHSTVALNEALVGGGIAVGAGDGTVSLDHTIVARNSLSMPSAPDISGAVQARYSLIGNNAGVAIIATIGNLIGTPGSPINPLLGELNYWGGPTQTHPLLVGSQAIDAGEPFADEFNSVPDNDQRGAGFDRIQNGVGVGARIDIGAYEVQHGSISGHKWNDLDGDGVWDQPDEPGLPGWIVFLDDNRNGGLDAGESYTVTDSSGAYSFEELPPVNYSVAEIMLPGWTQTTPGGPNATSLIVNGGFETGNFMGWFANGFVINNGTLDPQSPDGPLPPYEGSYSALWNSGGGQRDIYQTVTLPVGDRINLNWAHRIRNHHTAFIAGIQEARVEVRNTSNQVLATLFRTLQGNSLLQEWTTHTADLSAFAGQTVRIAFVVVANNFYLNLHVDAVNITTGDPVGAIPVKLAEGQDAENIDFGNWIVPTGEIHGAKWNDLNGNGVWEEETEPGLAGWTIYLDANDNGALDPGERTTTTGEDGRYTFTGLAAGDYLVSELMLPGWVQTSPAPIDTSGLIVNGTFESGTFTGWTQPLSNSFLINNGNFDPPGTEGPLLPFDGFSSALTITSGLATLYQDVLIPANSHLKLEWAHRIRNTGFQFQDPTIEYRVQIASTTNQLLATLYSTNPGDALLQDWQEHSADLSAFAGQTVRIIFAKSGSGLYFHLDNVRISESRPVKPIEVVLGVGQVVEAINFGNWIAPEAEIHGYKWNDLNGNGVWEQPEEPALPGTIVYLDANASGALEFGEAWTTTAADGSYSFTDLPAGEYIVAEVVPAGWTQTYPGDDTAIGAERLFAVRGVTNAQAIYELNPTTGEVVQSFPAPLSGVAGGQGLALGPRSLFYVEGSSSTASHILWEINPDTGAVIDSDVVDGPSTGTITGVAYLDGKVYMQKSFNQFLVWDPVADALSATLTVPGELSLVGLTGAGDLGWLYGVGPGGAIYRIDPTNGVILATLPPSQSISSTGLAYINSELLVARSSSAGTVARLNPLTGALLGNITVAGTGTIGGLAGDGARLFEIAAHVVTVAANEIVTGVNFGNWIEPPAEIHGYKWHDLDGDGVWDQPEEPALADWLIYLDTNGNAVLDNGEPWTTTAADGSYSFTGLPAGEYIVAELLQPGWTQSAPDTTHPERERLFQIRGTGGLIYELDPLTGQAINAFSAPTNPGAGNQGLAVGPRSLFYIDGISSGTHTLYELNPDTGAVIDSDVVDASLTGFVDGLAYLNGKVYVQKPTADRILVWDPVSDTLVTTLVVAADLGGGLTGAADLGVLYASRTNGNVVAIHPLTGAILATYSPSFNFLSGLAYVHGELLGLRSGTSGTAYRIDPLTGQLLGTFTAGGTGSTGALGGDGVTGISPGVHIVELVPGQSLTNVNFGNWIAGPAEIHGTKWNDLDQDGVWDQPTEPGLAGWTVFLDSNGNGVLNDGEMSTVTGEDGSYSFSGLAPGVYAVREVLQTGWAQTRAVPFVSLDLGERATGVNFGNRALPGSISGYKWNDLDGDGEKEVGEPGLSDWVIFLDANGNGTFDDGESSTATNLDGFYSISQVPVGEHTVAEVQQPGWVATYAPPVVVVGPGQAVENVNFGNRLVHPLGDYNRDTAVDAADYVVWRKFDGTSVSEPYSGADGDGNAVVDAGDEAVWKLQFGSTSSLDENQIAGSAPQTMQVAAVIGADSVTKDGASVSPGIRVQLGVDIFRSRGENSRKTRIRETSRAIRSVQDRLDVALSTWLLQVRNQVEDDDEATSRQGGDDDRARDAYFASFETELGSTLERAVRDVVSRSGARLAALG